MRKGGLAGNIEKKLSRKYRRETDPEIPRGETEQSNKKWMSRNCRMLPPIRVCVKIYRTKHPTFENEAIERVSDA